MDLNECLKQACFAGLTDAECLAYGNGIVVVSRDDREWSFKGVADRWSSQLAEDLYGTLIAMGKPGSAQLYLQPGWQLSLDKVQDDLTQLAAGLTANNRQDLADICLQLKAIGITKGTRWSAWGVDQPTVEDIAAVRVGPHQRARIIQFCNEVWNPAIANENTTIAELQALAADAENWS